MGSPDIRGSCANEVEDRSPGIRFRIWDRALDHVRGYARPFLLASVAGDRMDTPPVHASRKGESVTRRMFVARRSLNIPQLDYVTR